MIILGINDIAHHNTSAAVIRDGEVIAAVEEERLSRIKLDNCYPDAAIDAALGAAGVAAEDVNAVALAGLSSIGQHKPLNKLFRHIREAAREDAGIRRSYRKQQFDRYARLLRRRPSMPARFARCRRSITEHHRAHAASAYYTSPFGERRVGVITQDGSGDAVCASVWIGEQGRLRHVTYLPTTCSLGQIYSAFTVHLGFRHTRHEGKVLGLAAYGDPEPMLSRLMALTNAGDWQNMLHPRLMRLALRFASGMGQETAAELSAGLKPEDVAAGLQAFTETMALSFIQEQASTLGVRHLALAGGVFANVRLNQRILALPGFRTLTNSALILSGENFS